MSANISVQDLLEESYKPLNVEQDCPHCVRSHQCRKQIKITRLPHVLIIHLVRYLLTSTNSLLLEDTLIWHLFLSLLHILN